MIIKNHKTVRTMDVSKKSASRKTGKAAEERAEFQGSLDDLFEVAHIEPTEHLKNLEDRPFLSAQRCPCRADLMVGVDN